jgi:hypothetical protein
LPRARRYFNRIRLEEDRTRLSPRRYSSRSRCRTGSAPARRHSFGRDRWPLARRILSWARASRPAAAAPAARGHSACPLTTQHYIGGCRSDNRVERFAAACIDNQEMRELMWASTRAIPADCGRRCCGLDDNRVSTGARWRDCRGSCLHFWAGDYRPRPVILMASDRLRPAD